MNLKRTAIFTCILFAAFAVSSWNASACYVCLGDPESPMTKGMTLGILSLMAVIGTMLLGVSSFFIYLAKRNSAGQKTASASNPDLSAKNSTR